MHRFSAMIFFFIGASLARAQTGTFLDRVQASDLRIADYNVNWDSIFPDNDAHNSSLRCCNKVNAFRRLIAAISPDVMCLQEIESAHPLSEITAIFDAALPLAGGAHWQAARGYSNVTVSRWALSLTATQTVPPGDLPQCMALVDLPNANFAKDLYLINEHYKCCGGTINDNRRQKQSDALVNWMRDARTAGGSITLPGGTPIIILGDLNIVGSVNPLNTLICGDISDNAAYGPDSPPDWDGTCDADAHPLHNVVGPADYTWRDDSSGYPPSRLDYIIHTDSQLTVAKKFVLNTTAMSAGELAATGLQADDVVLVPPGDFDHLPLVIDYRLASVPAPADGDVSLDGSVNGEDVSWFVGQVMAGASGDPARISHGDFNSNGIVDTGDVTGFVAVLLSP